MVKGKWMRRVAWAVASVLVLWVVAWLAVPPLVKWQAPRQLSAALGREVTLGGVDFHPWALEVVLHDLAVAAAPAASGAAAAAPAAPLLRVGRVRANVALSSLFRRAPVIEAIDIDQAHIALARTAPGHYDIDDLIRRFAPRPGAKPSEPARFALYNLQVHDLGLRFDDRPAGHVHVVDKFELSLPFLSNLPANVDITVQPHLAFRLNGAPFDSAAQATPFAATDHGTLKLTLADLDVRPYLGYLPESLPLRLTGGALSADLSLAFAQPAQGATSMVLKGWVAAHDVAATSTRGQPLLAWKQLRVGLADVQPLAHKLAFDSVKLDGVQWFVDRDASGSVDPLREGAQASAAAAPAKTVSAASAPASAAEAAPAPPWDVRIAALDIADSRITWNDASTKPAATLVLDGLALRAKAIAWPSTSPATFTASANVSTSAAAATGSGLASSTGSGLASATGSALARTRPDPAGIAPATGSALAKARPDPDSSAARLALEGQASSTEARVAITLSGLSLRTLAPYLAQTLVPRVDGRLGAKASLTWSGKPDAPALKIALAEASLDALRVQPPGAAQAASWDRLAVDDLQVDVPGRTVTLASVKLVHPDVAVARDAAGQVDAAHWLRASEAASAPAPAASSPASPPWHVQVRSASLDGGLLRFSDASLHPEQHLPPLRAELRQLQLEIKDYTWFGDHPVPPAKVTLDGRIGRPSKTGRTSTRGGQLGWKGTLGASPLQARGDLRVARFPVALVTPWVADKLPLALLRAEAGYTGHLDLQSAPAGLTLSTSGDALLSDVHLTTLSAARPGAAASAPAAPSATGGPPDELIGWQSLSLKGVKFAMKPSAKPRLDIGQVELDDLFARVLVTEQGRLNLQDIGGSDATASPPAAAASAPASAAVAAASAPAAAASEPLPIDIAIGGIKLVNARIDYADHFVKPNYSAALTELDGSLGAFSTLSRDMAPLQLHGRAEGTAILDISGQVNPLARPLALDIQAKATDLELAPLTPYAGKYAGYAIERGKLSMDVAYKIDAQGHLEAKNQVILNQLTFGEPIASPDATKLPVRLAVALLKDRNGVIDINLPISGSLNDPQFSVGGIVLKLIGNLLLKAVTSPFALLTGGGGGGGPDLSAIEFKPGTAVMTDASAASLDKVAKALADRPALQTTITGSADPQAEHDAWQRAQVDAQLRTMARDDALRSGAPASAAASEAAALPAASRSALLKTLYKQTRIPDKPRNLIGLAKDLPDAEMEELLRKNVPVNDEAMRQEALARAIAVRDALVARGISSNRLFLAAPSLHAAGGEAWTPRASLSLAMP